MEFSEYTIILIESVKNRFMKQSNVKIVVVFIYCCLMRFEIHIIYVISI